MRKKLAELVCVARLELDGCTEDGFAIGESRQSCYAEILVWCTSEPAQVMVFGRPNEVPSEKVS